MCRFAHGAEHEGHRPMTSRPEQHHDDAPDSRRKTEDSILPLAVRQRLWDQVWIRLLAPPGEPADKASAPTPPNQRDGGQR